MNIVWDDATSTQNATPASPASGIKWDDAPAATPAPSPAAPPPAPASGPFQVVGQSAQGTLVRGNPSFPGYYVRTSSGDYQLVGDDGKMGAVVPKEKYEGVKSPSPAPNPNGNLSAGGPISTNWGEAAGDAAAGLVRRFVRPMGDEDVVLHRLGLDNRFDRESLPGQAGGFVGDMASLPSLALMAATGGVGKEIAAPGAPLIRRMAASALAGGMYTGTRGTAERAQAGETPTLESVVQDVVPGAVAGPVGEAGGEASGKLAAELPGTLKSLSRLGGGASTAAAANVAASATAAKMQGRAYTMQDAERDAFLGVAAHIAAGGSLHDLNASHGEPYGATEESPASSPPPVPAGNNADAVPSPAQPQVQGGGEAAARGEGGGSGGAAEVLKPNKSPTPSPTPPAPPASPETSPEAMPASVPTLNPDSPGVKRVTRPPGGRDGKTPLTPEDRVALKRELASRDYPEGSPVHGTDISALGAIAREGIQPGRTYQQGGSSDEGVVYGSKVKGGDPGQAASYAAAKAPNLPAVLVLKPHTEGVETGPGNITLHSKSPLGGRASYVRPEDVEKVVIPGQPDMTLPEAAEFAKKYMGAKNSRVLGRSSPSEQRYELTKANSLPEARGGVTGGETTGKPAEATGGAPRANAGRPAPSGSTAGGSVSGEEPEFVQTREMTEEGNATAKKLGVKFDGAQEGVAPGEHYLQYTDPQTRSTILVKAGEDAGAKLAEMRAKFAARAAAKGGGKEVAPAASATPKGGGAEYVRSRPEPQEQPTPKTEGSKFLAKQYSLRAIEKRLHEWVDQRDEQLGRNTLPHVPDESGGSRQLEHPVLPPDALDGLAPTDKARLSKYVDEDEWSNVTKDMSAKQISTLQDQTLSRLMETKKDRLARALKEAKASDDPRAQFLAHYYENSPAFGEKIPKQWFDAGKLTEDDVGKSFEIHGEKFRVEERDGDLVLQDHITIHHPEALGKIPIDKGSLKEPEEADISGDFVPAEKKTSGQQKGLLGEAFDGPTVGSKTGSMFGDMRTGPASELEAKGNEVGQAKKDNETTEMFQDVPPADKAKGELEIGDKFPFPGSKPKDKFPVVTDVRLTPEGQRQYQVRFSEKTDAKWMPPAKPVNPDDIGQRGLSSGPPGALQIAPLMKKARASIPVGEIRGLRERFAPIESKYGSGLAKAFIKTAAAPGPEAETMASSFLRRAFGDAPDPEKAASEWLDRGRFYRRRDLQRRLGPTAGTALPDIQPADLARMEADPIQRRADALWNREFAPLITDIRNRHRMIMNMAANDPKQFPIFLNLPGEYDGPEVTNTRVNPNKAFNKAAQGNTPLVMDPKEAIAAALRGHLATDYRQQLARVIDTAYSVPQNTVVPSGRRGWQGTFRGKTVEVEPIDLAPIGSRQSQIRMVPEDIAEQFNHIRQQRGNYNTLFDKAVQMGTKLATFGEAAPHSARLVAHVAARMGQAGENPANLLPGWLGSNVAAVRRMIQMSKTPLGETMQLLIDRSGSDKGAGFDVQQGQSRIQQWLAKPHNLLFDPETGVDPMGRRVVADAYLRTILGNPFMDGVEADLNAGRTTPVAASKDLESRLSAAKFVGLGRRVNDTLGFANKQTRSDLLNHAARIFPFISSESGMIPREVGKVVNLDAPATVNALQRGAWKQAALMVGGSLANGAVGTYLAANAFNYANTRVQTGTGKFLWDNDDGHKLDLWIAPGWYLSNLDPTFARGMRLTGLKGLANGQGWVRSVGSEAVNEPLSMLANTLKVGFTAATYMATGGKQAYAPYMTMDRDGSPGLLKTSAADNVPGFRNTAKAIEGGTGVGAGLVKDTAALATGAQLKTSTAAPSGRRNVFSRRR